MKITHCKTNHYVNPVGYLIEEPVFSWITEEAKGSRQVQARIVVKQGEEIAADTGWSEQNALAAPVAMKLAPRTRYTWTVAVRSNFTPEKGSGAENTEDGAIRSHCVKDGSAGTKTGSSKIESCRCADSDVYPEEAVSEEQFFETGKMDEPWAGTWIRAAREEDRHPIFSKDIHPRDRVSQARLYICGLGLYEASYNGKKIGTEYLTPYCNDYDEWLQYQTYDVTEELRQAGVLSIVLGNGWYKGRFCPNDHSGHPHYGDTCECIAELRIEYADGSEEVIGSDESWMVTRSTITFSNIYDGEIRDDTLPEVQAEPAVTADAPKGKLMERLSTPVTVQEEVTVKELITTPKGETVLDLGQNLTGSFRLQVQVPAGNRIHLQFGEILQDGCFYRKNLRTAKAEYFYTSDGQPQVLEPKFTFYGYRYVKAEGIDGLKPEDFTALVLHSELEKTGTAQTGSALVNQLLQNIDWGLRGNFLDVPTDCPQRDERMGWTGDAQVFAPTACYMRDSYAFYKKYLYDLKQEQKSLNGGVPNVVPSFDYERTSSAAWGDAACVIPWVLYEYYGDLSILSEQYESMCGWVEFIRRTDGEDHSWRKQFHYGDWLALDAERPEDLQGGTDVGFIADVMYLRCVRLTAQAAQVLQRTKDQADYEALAGDLLDWIRYEYFTPSGRAAISTQTALVLSYRYGLGTDRARTAADLAARMKKDEGHLRTGFVGTPLLLPVLSQTGNSAAAYDLLLYEAYPGWLYEVKMGATTVWERWNSVGPDGVIADNGMNSLNHYSYGSVAEWICGYAAGLRPAAPGFRAAVLQPEINVQIGSVAFSYRSASGLWKVCWEVTPAGEIHYMCTVPFDCTASLTLPYGGGTYILTAGTFEVTYLPDQPLKTLYSIDTPLGDLLDNGKVKAVLTQAIPKITQLPPSMRGMSIRQIMARMGTENEEMLAKIGALLKSI